MKDFNVSSEPDGMSTYVRNTANYLSTLTRILGVCTAIAKPFDPEQAWADHLNRLADIDKLYPSKTPLLARHISPPLSTKRLFDIHGNLVTDYDYLPSFPSLLRKKPLFDLLEPSPMAPISAFTRDPWWYPSYAPYIPSYAQKATPFYLRDSYLSPVKRSYLWSRHPIRPFAKYQTQRNRFVQQYACLLSKSFTSLGCPLHCWPILPGFDR
ncbi:unnamed protein product, partial [Heterotrigona itama]